MAGFSLEVLQSLFENSFFARGQVVIRFDRSPDELLALREGKFRDLLQDFVQAHSVTISNSPGTSHSYLVEKYTDAARERSEVRGGLPIRQLHKVEDYVGERLACLFRAFSFQHVSFFPPLSPLQFVTPERITRGNSFQLSASLYSGCAAASRRHKVAVEIPLVDGRNTG
jgi:hypothetical protein